MSVDSAPVTGPLQYLQAKIDWVEHKLTRQAALVRTPDAVVGLDVRIAILEQQMRAQEAGAAALLDRMRRVLHLDPFQEEALWLAVAAHHDGHLGELIATVYDDGRRDYVTPWLCLQLFCAHRRERLLAERSLGADSALFRRGLLSAHPRDAAPFNRLQFELVPAPWLVDLAGGGPGLGRTLAPFAREVAPSLTTDGLASDRDRQLDGLRSLLGSADTAPHLDDPSCGPSLYDFQKGFTVLLTGPPGCGKTLACRALAGEHGKTLLEVDAALVAGLPTEDAVHVVEAAFDAAAFTGRWLLLDDCQELLKGTTPGEPGAGSRPSIAAVFRKRIHDSPVVALITADSIDGISPTLRERMFVHHELRSLSRQAGALAWQLNMPGPTELAGGIDFARLAEDYALTGRRVQNAINLVLRAAGGDEVAQPELMAAAERQQTPGMGNVARRTWVSRSRADLMLPEALGQQIDEIIATESVRESVLRSWGLGARLQKGLGLICLFDGEPGTGKTLSAEVVASELGMPLYTVNVANVVSKWVGETEKNLSRIFEDAQKNRCLLLFDEADTLFSKRTQVERAVDRFSNMEVGLLLELVESYRGLVILTTNLKSSIDSAFMRRIAFKLSYPLPSAETRALIWRHLLPKEHVGPDVNIDRLAHAYEFAGGNIRNVVLRAAYRAAVEQTQITARILAEIAVNECKASGKLVREAI